MTEIVFVVEEAPEGAMSRGPSERRFTPRPTRSKCSGPIREAVACHFEEGQGPRVIRLHLVRDELLAP